MYASEVPLTLLLFYRSYSIRLAGYEFKPAVLGGEPRKVLFGNKVFDPATLEGNVRGTLMIRLGCDIPHYVNENGEGYYILVPPGVNHEVGVEGPNELAFKAKAEKLGFKNNMKWVHLKNPAVDYW
ncbi:hypothetical protein FS749_006417 [Ceratobasidium sp. UAMH 11750]|nr:hypothetical protein FS749_006417 [Ceratobasidium sp. UAMH 11750]